MLSQHTLKHALVAFRARMNPPLQFNDRGMPTSGHRSTADLQLIDRWIDDERAEAIWRKLTKQRPHAEPIELIRAVLKARRMSGATISRKYLFSREWSEVLSGLKKHVAAFPESLGPLRVAEILYHKAEEIRDLHDLWTPDDGLNALFELSRKDQRGSRKRRLFIQILGEYLKDHFGRPFDEEVAVLCEIALGDGSEVDREHAKDARRASARLSRNRRGGTFRRKKRPRTSLTN